MRHTQWIYGTCKATEDTGCPFPLAIQVWPACERSPADYTKGCEPYKPIETTTVRGVPTRLYDEERLEPSTGDVTVVIFGEKLMLEAARQLRSGPDSPNRVTVDQPLPPPTTGAQDGILPCK